MGFTSRGIPMRGIAKIALFGPLLSQKVRLAGRLIYPDAA